MPKDNRTVMNVPADEILRIMRENEIAKMMKERRQPVRECPVCEATFVCRSKWQKFCHPKCRNMWHGVRRAIARRPPL